MAEKGEALTVSDVVARAAVSNGTFYNYFADRDDLIDTLAEDSVISLAAESAFDTSHQDPAKRFATATARVLLRAERDPDWGRIVLRLVDRRRSYSAEMGRYLREDLADGFRQGRFTLGDDEISLDLILGFLFMSIRRIVRGDASADHAKRVVERALCQVGIKAKEATRLAEEAIRQRQDASSSALSERGRD